MVVNFENYSKGIGIPPSNAKAYAWLKLAHIMPEEEEMPSIDDFAKNLTEEELEAGEDYFWGIAPDELRSHKNWSSYKG